MIKRWLYLLIALSFVSGIFLYPANLNADVKMPLEVSIEYAEQPQPGQPVKILVSVKPLIDGESLKIKLIIPGKRIEAISSTSKVFDNPLSGQSCTLPVTLYIPDGKAYQIIADGYLTSEGQVYSDSQVINIDLGKPEAPEYPLVKSISPDGLPIIGVVGKQKNKSKGIKR